VKLNVPSGFFTNMSRPMQNLRTSRAPLARATESQLNMLLGESWPPGAEPLYTLVKYSFGISETPKTMPASGESLGGGGSGASGVGGAESGGGVPGESLGGGSSGSLGGGAGSLGGGAGSFGGAAGLLGGVTVVSLGGLTVVSLGGVAGPLGGVAGLLGGVTVVSRG
jgi:hypothetical protein